MQNLRVIWAKLPVPCKYLLTYFIYAYAKVSNRVLLATIESRDSSAGALKISYGNCESASVWSGGQYGYLPIDRGIYLIGKPTYSTKIRQPWISLIQVPQEKRLKIGIHPVDSEDFKSKGCLVCSKIEYKKIEEMQNLHAALILKVT